jgi:endonuclease YncB( thermonuclease family)
MGNCCCRVKDDQYHTNELVERNFDDVSKFTFNGMVTKAKVVDVYDGDTITIVFYFRDQVMKDSFRMYGYDAPEIKPLKSIDNRDHHIRAGKAVREYLKKLILGRIVWVKFCQEEKYGRLMGYIYDDHPRDENEINALMIRKGYGKPYQGGHKQEFTDEELLTILSKLTVV